MVPLARSPRAALAGLVLALAGLPGAAHALDAPAGAGFTVERYEVALRPDLATTAVSGRETVVIRATAPDLREVAFSPTALAIGSATAAGAPVAVRARGEAVVFVLPRALAAGETARLAFDFAGVPRRGVVATPTGLYTSYFACDWMVCLQDAPGDKADFALDLFVPAGSRTLGVGREIGAGTPAGTRDSTLEGGLERHAWRSERPVSAYLFAFAAGRFPQVVVPAGTGSLAYLDATGTGADLPARFAETPAMAAFFAQRAGAPLPGGHYAQLLVPGDEAQESASFSLIGEADIAADASDPQGAWAIAHELAHQWWGNLVTTRTWRDFWLNEGFATFMVAAWKEHRFGEPAYRAEVERLRARRARLAATGWDRPLAWDGTYPSLGTRRAVQYSKGALFLVELRARIGDAAFWQAIRTYTRDHAGGSVVSADFQRAAEAAAGRSLQPMFDEWVYGTWAQAPAVGEARR